MDAGTALIDRHPDTRFIVDHPGIVQPRVPPAATHPWADLSKVLELAKRANAVIKVTGACTLSQEPYPFPEFREIVQAEREGRIRALAVEPNIPVDCAWDLGNGDSTSESVLVLTVRLPLGQLTAALAGNSSLNH